jgi:hypothetical protein
MLVLSAAEVASLLDLDALADAVQAAMLELGARDRAQLVVFAYQAGLVIGAGYPRRRVVITVGPVAMP